MKSFYVTIMLIAAVFMLLSPLTAAAPNTKPQTLPVMGTPTIEPENVRVLNNETGQTETYTLADYLFGVVSAEMPALYEPEALKAQAVAAYTFYLRKKETNSQKDYDITNDYSQDQAFISPAAAKEKWGSNADSYETKIRAAINSVLYKKVTYNGQIAATVYHAISFGKTETAADVWGGEYPYLVSVDSNFDKFATNYLSVVTFTAAELKTALSGVAEVKNLTENCFSAKTLTTAGSVKSLKVGGTTVSGAKIRKALNLRSTDFDIAFENGTYTFTVRGYGHAIGMSQFGANYLAQQGKTWQEILLYYYTGCQIE